MANNKGQSIVEVLVGLGLISMIGLAFVGGMVNMRNTVKNTVVMSSTDKQINDIAENIKVGIENYQINYNIDIPLSETLNPAKLPMAWDQGRMGTRKECPACQGSYGFDIRPNKDYPGLYEVTLRLTHKSWGGPEAFQDYKFVVSVK